MDIKKTMLKISRASGGGKVTLVMPSGHDVRFFAHVFPTDDQARNRAIEILEAQAQKAGTTSIPLGQFTSEWERQKDRAMFIGSGDSPEEAFEKLAELVKGKLPTPKRATKKDVSA